MEKDKKRPRRGIRYYLLESTYGVSFGGLTLLVMLAFFGPQLVFAVQDQYQGERAWQGVRNSLDMETMSQTYEELRERLAMLADIEGDAQINVAGTEYEVNSEFYAVLDNVMGTDSIYTLESLAGLPGVDALEKRAYTVNQWKKYIVYSDDYQKGTTDILLSAWYAELETDEGIRMDLLVDTVNYELYYIRTNDYGSVKETVDAKNKDLVSYYDAYGVINDLRDREYELFYYIYDYYRAGVSRDQLFEDYLTEMAQTRKEGPAEVLTIGDGYADERFRITEYSIQLPYWDNYLKWELLYCDYYDMNDSFIISVGIAEIAELIPELQDYETISTSTASAASSD